MVRRRGHLRRRRAEHAPRRDALRRRLGQQATADLLHLRRYPVDARQQRLRAAPCRDDQRACDAGRRYVDRLPALRRTSIARRRPALRFRDGHAGARSQPRDDRDVHDPAHIARRARVSAGRAPGACAHAVVCGRGGPARHRRWLQAGRRLRRRGHRSDDLDHARPPGPRARTDRRRVRRAADRLRGVLPGVGRVPAILVRRSGIARAVRRTGLRPVTVRAIRRLLAGAAGVCMAGAPPPARPRSAPQHVSDALARLFDRRGDIELLLVSALPPASGARAGADARR